jgi:hypothetical protein
MSVIYANPHIPKELVEAHVDALSKNLSRIRVFNTTSVSLINALNYCIVNSAGRNKFSDKTFSKLVVNELLFLLKTHPADQLQPLATNFINTLKGTKNLYLPTLKLFIVDLIASISRFPPQQEDNLSLKMIFEALSLLIRLTMNSKKQNDALIYICDLGNVLGASNDNEILIRNFCDQKVGELVKQKKISLASQQYLVTLLHIRSFSPMYQNFTRTNDIIRETIQNFCLEVPLKKTYFWSVCTTATQNFYFASDPERLYTIYHHRVQMLIEDHSSLINTIVYMKLISLALTRNKVYLPKVIATVLNGFLRICTLANYEIIKNAKENSTLHDDDIIPSLFRTTLESIQEAHAKFPAIESVNLIYFEIIEELLLLHVSFDHTIPGKDPERLHSNWEIFKDLIFFRPQQKLSSEQYYHFMRNQLLFNKHVEIAPILEPLEALNDPETLKLEAELLQILDSEAEINNTSATTLY